MRGNFIKLYLLFRFGELAQLVERLHGMQEVSGSRPLFSTKSDINKIFFISIRFFNFILVLVGKRMEVKLNFFNDYPQLRAV